MISVIDSPGTPRSFGCVLWTLVIRNSGIRIVEVWERIVGGGFRGVGVAAELPGDGVVEGGEALVMSISFLEPNTSAAVC